MEIVVTPPDNYSYKRKTKRLALKEELLQMILTKSAKKLPAKTFPFPRGGTRPLLVSQTPNCPECQSEYTYESGPLFACPDCGHEWSAEEAAAEAEARILRDAHGNELQSGDTVQLTKDLKVKGTSTTLKIGTKVKNIRINPGADHDIDCKVDGIGPMKLKSQFVKKI